jgi:hypothetical protein
MSPCSLVEVDRRFRCAHFLHHQGVNDGDSKHLWKVGLLLQPYSVPYSGRLSPFYFYLFHKVKSKAVPTRLAGAKIDTEHRSYSFLTSILDRGWVVSVTPRPRFTPGERSPLTNWTGGWVGLRPALATEARKRILCLCRWSNPSPPVCSQTL